MSVNGEIHNAYKLYNITNIVTIAARGNFTKETIISLEYRVRAPMKLGGDGEFRSGIFSGSQAFLSINYCYHSKDRACSYTETISF